MNRFNSYPTPFCFNPKQAKVIVLGADPSNFSDEGNTKRLTKVFGIGDGDPRYFQGMLNNLKEIGLGLEDIFVDNLIQEYLEDETSKNKGWANEAKKHIPQCKERLDTLDPAKNIPILITAEEIYKVLCDEKPIKAKDFYSGMANIPVLPAKNLLERKLIPFYRHQVYNLAKQKPYRERIKEIL